jgi:hypothetical protein
MSVSAVGVSRSGSWAPSARGYPAASAPSVAALAVARKSRRVGWTGAPDTVPRAVILMCDPDRHQ